MVPEPTATACPSCGEPCVVGARTCDGCGFALHARPAGGSGLAAVSRGDVNLQLRKARRALTLARGWAAAHGLTALALALLGPTAAVDAGLAVLLLAAALRLPRRPFSWTALGALASSAVLVWRIVTPGAASLVLGLHALLALGLLAMLALLVPVNRMLASHPNLYLELSSGAGSGPRP